MAAEDRFAELRSILQEAPSARTWRALCAQLEHWDRAPLQELALPYALGHVQRWPEHLLRDVPERWLAQILRDEPQPGLVLCDTLALVPPIMSVDQMVKLINAPQLGPLRSLTINTQYKIKARTLKQVLDTPKLRTLERLFIHQLINSSLSLEALTLAPIDALKGLSLVSAQLDDVSWSKLAREARWRSALTTLDLSHNNLTADTGFRHLLRASAPAATLSELCLNNNQLSDTLIEALADAPRLGALTTLNLRANRISDAGVARLIGTTHLRSLRSLILSDNSQLTANSAQQLASDASRLDLELLALDGVGLGVEGAKALAKSARLGALRTLSLERARLNDVGARALIESERLPALRELNLNDNELSDDTALTLARAPQSQRLTSLSLTGNRLTERGAQALASSPYLSGLTSLLLPNTLRYGEGAHALANSPHLSEAVRARWVR